MSAPSLTLRSSVTYQILNKKLRSGITMNLIGTLGLIFLGTRPIASPPWNFILFFSFLACIFLGTYPYCYFNKLNRSPHLFVLTPSKGFFYLYGQATCSIKNCDIEKLSFTQDRNSYYIEIKLRDKNSLIWENVHRKVKTQLLLQENQETKLKLPFFNQRAFKRMKEFLQEVKDLPVKDHAYESNQPVVHSQLRASP